MRRLAVLALLGMVMAANGFAQDAAKPAMDIVEKIKDFGTVPKGEKLHAVFVVANQGAAPLEITQVKPTCGCTVANFDRTIAPGAKGKIEAEVDTTAFTGPISKVVNVYTNDPSNPQVNLVIKADVRTFIEVLPRPLLRFNVLKGEPATEKVTLVSFEGAKFKVTGVDTPDGTPYQVGFRELPEAERMPDRPGSQWEATVTVPPTAAEGVLNHKLTIATTDPKAPAVQVTVSGVVRPVVQVIPAQVNFGVVSTETPVGRNVILVNNRQGSDLQLTKVDVDNPNFKAEAQALPGGRYQLAVHLQPGAKGAQRGTVRISTNDPSYKLIEIPVQADAQ